MLIVSLEPSVHLNAEKIIEKASHFCMELPADRSFFSKQSLRYQLLFIILKFVLLHLYKG